jgi:hypothetical protein
MSERVGATEAREEGFYWVIFGQNAPEIAYGKAANGGWPAMRGHSRRKQ